MKCIFCESLILDEHDASEIHAYCWKTVYSYAKVWQHQMHRETNCIDKVLFKKLENLVHHKRLWVWTLIHSYLEMAVAHDKIAQHDTAVNLLEEVLVRCIKGGSDENLSVVRKTRSGRVYEPGREHGVSQDMPPETSTTGEARAADAGDHRQIAKE